MESQLGRWVVVAVVGAFGGLPVVLLEGERLLARCVRDPMPCWEAFADASASVLGDLAASGREERRDRL